MFTATYLISTFAIGCFVVAGYLLIRLRSNLLARSLAWFTAGIGLWSISNAGADVSYTIPTLVFWSGMAVASSAIFTPALLTFVEYFISPNAKPSKVRLAIYLIPGLLIAALSFSRYSIAETYLLYTEPAQIAPGPLYLYLLIYYYGGFGWCYYRLIRAYRTFDRQKRGQALMIIAGTAATVAGSAIFTFLLPYLGEYRFYSLAPTSSIFMLAAFSVAIFRYNLLEIRLVIQRGIIFSVTLALVVGTYLGLLTALGQVLEVTGYVSALVSGLVTAIIGIFGVPTIDRFLRRLTDPIFFKDRYDYAKALAELSKILNLNLERRQIMDQSAARLNAILRIERVAYFLVAEQLIVVEGGKTEQAKGPLDQEILSFIRRHDHIQLGEQLRVADRPATSLSRGEQQVLARLAQAAKPYNVALIIPITLEGQLIAALGLGIKRSGDPFTPTDLQLLRTFAFQAAVALRKAELYEQLSRYSVHLEEEVTKRTAELKQLQEEQKQMMFDIAHNLQTPLTVIRGTLDGLMRKTPKSTSLKAFDTSIEKLARFIYDLLKLARLDRRVAEPLQLVDLSTLVNEQNEYFNTIAKENSIQLKTDISPNVLVSGVKDQLDELLTNLVSNAVKYIANERQITIRLTANAIHAVLQVEDSGQGIAAEDMPNLFKRFYRATNQTQTGSGLGLAICKSIVEHHHGSIHVESELGKGTTMTVRVPLAHPVQK